MQSLARRTVTTFMKRGKTMLSKRENGLTLLEVLLSLAILSSVGILIWGVFHQGTSYSKMSMTKNTMQQEANTITTALLNTHRTQESYEINSTDCKLSIISKTTNKVFENAQLCFKINKSGTINPKSEDIPVTLTITDKNNTDNEVAVKALLFRLKSGDNKNEEEYFQ